MLHFNTEPYIGIRRTDQSSAPNHQRGDQPPANHGTIPFANTSGTAQNPSQVLLEAPFVDGQSKEWRGSVQNCPNSQSSALEQLEADQPVQEGWCLQSSARNPSQELAERSPLMQLGWTMTRPTKKVKMKVDVVRSGLSCGEESGVRAQAPPPITYSAALRSGGRPQDTSDEGGRGDKRTEAITSRSIKVTLEIQQTLGVENLPRMLEGVRRFVEEYQALDPGAVLLPYDRGSTSTNPPIGSLDEFDKKNYFQAKKYFKCTNTWLLLKPPVTKEFLKQRELNGQKGPTPIYLRLWIQTTLPNTDLTDAFESVGGHLRRHDRIALNTSIKRRRCLKFLQVQSLDEDDIQAMWNKQITDEVGIDSATVTAPYDLTWWQNVVKDAHTSTDMVSEVVKSMFQDIGTIWVGKQLIGGMVCRIDLNRGGGIWSTKLDRGGGISKAQRSNLSKRDKGLSRQPKS